MKMNLLLEKNSVLIYISMIILLFIVDIIRKNQRIERVIQKVYLPYRWPLYYTIIMLVILFGNYSSKVDFIYFQF